MKPQAIVALICLLSMNCGFGLSAQERESPTELRGSANWERVSKILANEKLTVHLVDGTTMKGKFVQADADSLTLLTKGNTTSTIIKRDEIQRIRRKSAAMGALIGTAAGIGGGAAVGAGTRGSSDMSRAATAGIGGVLFGLGGALVGGLIGVERTYYENPSPRMPPSP